MQGVPCVFINNRAGLPEVFNCKNGFARCDISAQDRKLNIDAAACLDVQTKVRTGSSANPWPQPELIEEYSHDYVQ